MAGIKTVKFSDLMPENETKSSGSSGFKRISDVIGQKLIVERFEFDKSAMGQDILFIHTENAGIIRSGSKVLIKQARLIERALAGNKMETQIVQEVSKKTGLKYFTFKDI